MEIPENATYPKCILKKGLIPNSFYVYRKNEKQDEPNILGVLTLSTISTEVDPIINIFAYTLDQ